ncbi:MAG: hypothetical protein ACREOC_14470 [Gemmatimonadales bacterium]
MELTQRKAFIGLVALTLAAATPALAQDTTATERTPQPGQQPVDSLTMPGQGGGADTSGFAGMERNDPTGARAGDVQPTETGPQADTAAAPPPSAGQAPTGAAAESRDPNGFRWTEPSDFAKAGQTPPVGAADAVQPKQPKDSLTMPGQGGAADTAGYSGMEREKPHKDHKAEKSDSTKP